METSMFGESVSLWTNTNFGFCVKNSPETAEHIPMPKSESEIPRFISVIVGSFSSSTKK